MKKIMVDMDEVLCTGGYLEIVNRFLNTHYTLEELPGYCAEDMIPKERLKEYYEYFKGQNVYEYSYEIKDAVEVLEKLSKKYEIYICTAYYADVYKMDYGRLLLDKYIWLQEHIPFISPYHYIFMNDKSLLECDIKIDDRLSNLNGYGEQKYLFSSYHNGNVTEDELKEVGATLVSGWKELERILLDVN